MIRRGRVHGANVRSVNYASSPLLAARTPPGRSRFVVALVALAFAVLAGRAVYVQVINADFYQREGAKRQVAKEDVPAVRARILDRNGDLLAASVPALDVIVNPRAFEADGRQRQALARLLEMPRRELDRRVAGDGRFAYLKRGADVELRAGLRELVDGGVKGLWMDDGFRRSYPAGESAAQVVGFTNIEQQGQEGIERRFDELLSGHDGERTVQRDRLGQVIDSVGEPLLPQPGHDVTLSIDRRIQFMAYQQLREAVAAHHAKAGSVVVLDAQTGEVLAMANLPSYAPEQRGQRSGAQLRNRALTDTFEPGSTMKAFTIALALEHGVRPSDKVDTGAGWIQVTGSTLRDTHALGTISVEQVLQKSSNVGTVKLSQKLEASDMWAMYDRIGLGHKPELEFPGAASGKLRPWRSWRPVEKATMAYGYGLSASLFQLAQAYTAFARDGDIAPVTLLKRDAPVTGERVMSARTARTMRGMLQLAAGPGGTAPKAQTVGYSVGGKTGTARKQEGKGYSTTRYRAWFVGLAPVSQPRIVVAVMVDEPGKGVYYGGEVAAPVFSRVVGKTLPLLGVAPDIEVQPGIVNSPGPAVEESF